MAKQKSMGETFQELRAILVAYARQETVEPLNKLTHYLGWGIPGALLVTLGTYLVSLGIVRGLQRWISWTSTGFGSLVPYLGAVIFLGAVLTICTMKAKSSMRAGDDGTRAGPR